MARKKKKEQKSDFVPSLHEVKEDMVKDNKVQEKVVEGNQEVSESLSDAQKQPLESISEDKGSQTPLEEKQPVKAVKKPSTKDVSKEELLSVVEDFLKIPPVIYLRFQGLVAGTSYHPLLRNIMKKLALIKKQLEEKE